MKITILLFSVFTSIWATTSVKLLLQAPTMPPEGLIDRVMGPFGALVFSVVGLWIAGGVIVYLVKRADRIQSESNADIRRRLEAAERRAEIAEAKNLTK